MIFKKESYREVYCSWINFQKIVIFLNFEVVWGFLGRECFWGFFFNLFFIFLLLLKMSLISIAQNSANLSDNWSAYDEQIWKLILFILNSKRKKDILFEIHYLIPYDPEENCLKETLKCLREWSFKSHDWLCFRVGVCRCCGAEDAPVLSVRGHSQHGVQDGVQRTT